MVPNEYKEIMIKVNIEKSDEALRMVEVSIKEHAPFTALNRIYYAIFYTVTALAEKHEFRTSKHSNMMGWFNKKFIHEDKVFDGELLQTYQDAFKFRQKGDYDSRYIASIDIVEELLPRAKEFIQKVKTVI